MILISNELDIIIHVIASQLSGHCDVISNLLWHHKAKRKLNECGMGTMCKLRHFYVIYGLVMSWKKWNNLCNLVTNCFCVHLSVILVFTSLVALQLGFGVYIPRCFGAREINTKIILMWVLKQFVTPVHTLFSISSVMTLRSWNNLKWNRILCTYELLMLINLVSKYSLLWMITYKFDYCL